MTPTLLALTAVLFAADPPAEIKTMREPHPLAPSLPKLTKEEEEKLDEIINRFIKADTAQSKSEEAKEAQRDFDALGPEAIPALIRGLNRAAQAEQTCPTIMIAKKLSRMLSKTDDQKLLDFARDEIGGGSPKGKHAGVLAELRTQCLLRKNALARANPTSPNTGAKTAKTMTTAELVAAAGSVGGKEFRALAAELEQRNGPEVLPGLSGFIKNNDTESQQFLRDLMDKHMARQTASVLKQKLTDKNAEIRRAALRTAAKSSLSLPDLIDALTDEDAGVREDAHQGILKWSKGEDFGPAADADKDQIQEAQKKWRAWLAKKPSR
jgi:hypothetical protein